MSEDNKTRTSRSGDVTPKREVSFLERAGGEKESGKQGDGVNVMVPAASTSAPAPSLLQVPVTRVQMKEVPVSEGVIMPTTAAQALPKTAQKSYFRSLGSKSIQFI